ncbi:MAG: FHA domain-containing protein [Ruminococcus sp.]|nr:FHA domain-containing protein [Ruminococcus sp.]
MDAILWIVIGIFLAFAIVATVFIVRSQKNRTNNSEIHISGGADIERGYLSNDNNYFKGGYGELEETVVIGYDYRRAGANSKTIKLINLRTSQSTVLNIVNQLTFGRSREGGCFSIEGDTSVSMYHCRMFVYNNTLYLEDLNSSNHTFVNSKRITEPYILSDGDEVKIGNTRFKVLF